MLADASNSLAQPAISLTVDPFRVADASIMVAHGAAGHAAWSRGTAGGA
jgi:hypothetical protein